MNNEEIKKLQGEYRQLIGDLSSISEKIVDFREILKIVTDCFEDGKTISTENFDRLIRVAQEYYTLDNALKEQLPDVDGGEGYTVSAQKEMLATRIEQLDQELIKNSVNAYFDLTCLDADKSEELEASKIDLRVLLEAPDGLDTAKIRPYASILTIVDNPDEELSDELMDEVDDAFSKPLVRAILRGRVVHSAVSDVPASEDAASEDHKGAPISGYSQTLD